MSCLRGGRGFLEEASSLHPRWVLKAVLEFATRRRGRKNSAEKAQKPQSGDYSQVVGVPGAWRVLTGVKKLC